MYEELLKRLREEAEPCEKSGCVQTANEMRQAADAIGKLQEDNAALNGTVSNLIEQIAELSKPRWIPVTERLPGEDGTFITAYSKGGVSQNWYMVFHHGGGKWYQNSEDTGEVTHWMPLPEPPKEET